MKRWLILILFVCSVFPAFTQDSRSTYLWNTTSVVIGMERSSLCFSTKTHYSASDDTREMTYLDCSFSRTMNAWLKLGAAFRFTQSPKESGDVYEYRPQFVTTICNNQHQIKYRSTNRLEHRSFNKGESHFRYYHNLFVDFPALLPKFPKTYVGEELFTKLNGEGLHLARFYGGLHIYEKQHFAVDLYYVFQKTKTVEEWLDSDVFGLNLIFKI